MKVKIYHAGLGAILALLVSLVWSSAAYAADSIITVPTTAISVTAPLTGTAIISYTIHNTGTHFMYYTAQLDPSPGYCSKGLETPQGVVVNGNIDQGKIVTGGIEARCYQQPGVYHHMLKIRQVAGPNDQTFTGDVHYDIPVTVNVPFQPINQEWFSTLLIQPNTGIIGRGDAFTTTLVVRNLQAVTDAFELKVRFYYDPTDGSMMQDFTTGNVWVNGNQSRMDYTWTGSLTSGETATMTVLSKGGPFVGAYPGSVVAQLPSGETMVKGLVVLKSKPQITGVVPADALPGERITITGKNFLTDVPSGTPAHDLFIWITDPVSQGVNNVYGDSQGMLWEDSSISFFLPANLKEDYVYWLRVYRAGHLSVSEPFVYRTGKVQPTETPTLISTAPVPTATPTPIPTAPAMPKFALDVQPIPVSSGGLFTATFTITNPAAITQTVFTTISLAGGPVKEMLSFDGPGEIEAGFGSVSGLGLSISQMRWRVAVPPNSAVQAQMLLVANHVSSNIDFPGFITWEIPDDVVLGSVTLLSTLPKVILKITSGPLEVDQDAQTCVNGDFTENDGSGRVLLKRQTAARELPETVILVPTSWGKSEVCFSLAEIPPGTYTLYLALNGHLSMPWDFVITAAVNSVYMPLIRK